ncbi:hypothetical protein HDV00_005783 [Rhizophlyctis rosea]|nr:hypothetical protein HDV00_005783 [Rhizophlyctis rosea]
MSADILEELKSDLQKLTLSDDKRRGGLPAPVLQKLFRWFDPATYQKVAPLVCKRWHVVARRDLVTGKPSPRVVLLNLKLRLTPGGQPNLQPTRGRCTCTTPLPLELFVTLPERYVKATGTRVAGEGLVTTVDLQSFPSDRASLQAFLTCTLKALTDRLPSNPPPNLSVVPWEVEVSSPLPFTDADKQTLASMFSTLTPHVIGIDSPPPDIFTYLPKTTVALRLTSIQEPLNFDRLPEQLPFLARLDLDGPTPKIAGSDTSSTSSDSSMTAESFSSLAALASTLHDLRLGQWFPIDSYTALLPTLNALTNLNVLHIPGLYQGDQTPSQLADLLVALPKLKELHGLGHVDHEFWDALDAKCGTGGPLQLRALTLEWEAANRDVIKAGLAGITKYMPNLVDVRIRIMEDGDGASGMDVVLDCLGEFIREREKQTKLKIVRVQGLGIRVEDIPRWATFNLSNTSGIRVTLG